MVRASTCQVAPRHRARRAPRACSSVRRAGRNGKKNSRTPGVKGQDGVHDAMSVSGVLVWAVGGVAVCGARQPAFPNSSSASAAPAAALREPCQRVGGLVGEGRLGQSRVGRRARPRLAVQTVPCSPALPTPGTHALSRLPSSPNPIATRGGFPLTTPCRVGEATSSRRAHNLRQKIICARTPCSTPAALTLLTAKPVVLCAARCGPLPSCSESGPTLQLEGLREVPPGIHTCRLGFWGTPSALSLRLHTHGVARASRAAV